MEWLPTLCQTAGQMLDRETEIEELHCLLWKSGSQSFVGGIIQDTVNGATMQSGVTVSLAPLLFVYVLFKHLPQLVFIHISPVYKSN